MKMHDSVILLTLTAVMLVASGCTPESGEVSGPLASAAEAREQRRAVTTLILAVQNEPINFMSVTYGGSPSQGGTQHGRHVAHNFLMIQDETGAWVPQLALEQPSLDRGTWRINTDGTMDTTWKIRPNVTWHDGAPFTSADLLFSLTVKTDREMPWPAGQERLVRSGSAPDPQTFVIHWSSPYNRAGEDPIVEPLARHLLEEVYRTDKPNFGASPLLSTAFIGLGPYRLVTWEQGSHMEFTRFDAYYLGRPPLDRVILRFLGDPNTMIANILAGEVDVLLPSGVDVDAALDVKRRWEGSGNQVRFATEDLLWYLQMQFRPEYARPPNGLTNRTVRQALYHAIDRQNLAEVMNAGLAPIADSWIQPTHPLRAQLDPAIPRYPYDPRRAVELLAQAGWARADEAGRPDATGRRADGIFVDQRSQAPFDLEIWGRQGRGESKIVSVVGNYWSTLGVQVKQNIVPAARARDPEYLNTHPGSFVNTQSKAFDTFFRDKLHTRNVPTPANRWAGTNRGGYSNPRVDALLDELVRTIDPRERLPLLSAALEEHLTDVALMPLFWDVSPVLTVKGVEGPITADKDVIANFFYWRKD